MMNLERRPTMDDPHLEADLFFGPCNDPDCPNHQLIQSGQLRPDVAWPSREHLRLVRDEEPSVEE